MICERCGKEFFEDWRKDKQQRKLPMRFCSRACANKREQTLESNEKRSLKLKGHVCGVHKPYTESQKERHREIMKQSVKDRGIEHKPIWGSCRYCGKQIDISKKSKKTDLYFCGHTCRNKYMFRTGKYNPKCKCNTSKWEYEFEECLKKHNIKYEHGKRDLIPSGLEIDFWLPDYNTAIELNGIWHYSEKPYGNHPEQFEERKRKDAIKESEVKGLGYTFTVFKDDEIKDKSRFFEEFISKL